MGQTFDEGQPIDLLKYSLFIMGLQDALSLEGVDSDAIILLADHFLTDFNREMSVEEAARIGKLRQ